MVILLQYHIVILYVRASPHAAGPLAAVAVASAAAAAAAVVVVGVSE